jgi:tRNA(fMet)-specific endonuclease VapC
LKYLLDTNACIALINGPRHGLTSGPIGGPTHGEPPGVRLRFEKELEHGAEMFVPSVVAYELWYGVAKSSRPEKNAKRVQTFFAGPVSLLPFEDGDAQAAGKVRAALEAAGRPIGAYDVLIAGQAVRHKLTLVTSNQKEFSRVKGLLWEDWGRE